MASRQDQLHSYQFAVQRVVSAVVMRDTDPAQSPFRRVAAATLVGALAAALGLAGAAVVGVLAGGGDGNWRDTGAVIVERESGARFVYRDGRLHPVLNYASALLAVGSPQGAHTVVVSRSALAGAARGVPLGIAGAPDSLPKLTSAPWTVCSRDGGSTLLVGAVVGGGRPLGDLALLLSTVDGERYLLWRRHRYRLREPRIVQAALGWDSAVPVPVAAALVDAVPAGVDLARIPVANRGRPSPAVPGARTGQVYVTQTQGGGKQFAVALADGLAPVTQVQADLLLGDPDTVAALGQHEATRLGQGDFAAARPSSLGLPHGGPGAGGAGGAGGSAGSGGSGGSAGSGGPTGAGSGPAALPATTPSLASAPASVCVVVPDAQGPADVRLDASVPDGDPAWSGEPPRGAARVDRVVVPPGRGALVLAVSSLGATSGTVTLVTDLGVRYPVPEPDVPAMLGYGQSAPVRLPADVVSLLPSGPALDPTAARTPAK